MACPTELKCVIGALLLILYNGTPTGAYSTSAFDLIMPGTKWCGPGNIAKHYDDLGTQVEADKCCRAHDNCEELIAPNGGERYGMTNDDLFPIFHCQCEQTFRNCLQSVHDMTSHALGRVYFSSRDRCFDYKYPTTSCIEWQWDTFRTRCLAYRVDTTKPKQWQFFELPFYTIRSDVDEKDHDNSASEIR